MSIGLVWKPELKDAFFDQVAIQKAFDKTTHKSLLWLGGRVREKTRQRIGKPNLAGTNRVNKKTGQTSVVKSRKPRKAGKAPIARVNDSNTLTLRNVQFVADIKASNVIIFIPIFGDGDVPGVHEHGGTVRVNAKLVNQLTKRGTVKKKKGQAQKRLVFGKQYPARSFAIPARPMLKQPFEQAVKKFKDKMEKGAF